MANLSISSKADRCSRLLTIFVILFMAALGAKGEEDFTVDGITYSDISEPYAGRRNIVQVESGICTDSVLTIPERVVSPSGRTYRVWSVRMFSFRNRKEIKKVSFPSGITILQGAFSGCSNIEELDLSSIGAVYREAFESCTNLRSVVLPENLTLLDASLFYNCRNLTDIDLSNITYIENRALYGCSLANCIPPRELKHVETYALSLTKGIKSIIFTGESTDLGESAFSYSNVETVTFRCKKDFNIPAKSFFKCANLQSVTIEGEGSIKEIGTGAFADCVSLNTFGLDRVTKIGMSAFEGCKSWTRLELPQTVTSIGDGAFVSTGITEMHIPEWLKESMVGKDAFAGSQIVSLQFPESWKNLENHIAAVQNSQRTIERVVLPGKCEVIPESVFFKCPNLRYVKGGKNIRKIGKNAFAECARLEAFEHNGDVDEVGSGAFYGCASLKRFKIGNDLKTIPYSAFYGCKALEALDCVIPGVESVGMQAFKGSGLTDITFLSVDKPVDIEWEAFRDCSRLEGWYWDDGFGVWQQSDDMYLKLPDNLRKIATDAFRNCTALKGLWLSSGDVAVEVTPNPQNGDMHTPFYGCTIERLVIDRDFTADDAGLRQMLPSFDQVAFLRLGYAFGWDLRDFTGLPMDKSGAVKAPMLHELQLGNRIDPVPSFAASPLLRAVTLRGDYYEPPRVGGFHPDTYADGTLDVENEDDYRAADGWREFFMKSSDIEDVEYAGDSVEPSVLQEEYYNLQGQKIPSPQRGAVTVIRKDDKIVKRIIW